MSTEREKLQDIHAPKPDVTVSPTPQDILKDVLSTRMMDRLEPTDLSFLAQHGERLRDAKKENIIDMYSSPKALKILATISEQKYAVLLELAKYAKPFELSFLIEDPGTLDAFTDEKNDQREIAYTLVQRGDVLLAKNILGRKDNLDRLLEQPKPLEWLQERFSVLDRVRNIIPQFQPNPEHLFSFDERKIDLFLSIADDRLRQLLAESLVKIKSISNKVESAEDFEDRIVLWDKLLSEEDRTALAREKKIDTDPRKKGLRSLLSTRMSWLRALETKFTTDGLRQAVGDAATTIRFAEGGAHSSLDLMKLDAKEMEARSTRDTIPIEAPAGAEQRKQEIQDILELGRIGPLLNRLIGSISIQDMEKWVGGGYTFANREFVISTDRGRKPSGLPGTLLHESGHALTQLISTFSERIESFDRYAVEAMFGGRHGASAYSEAVGVVTGKESFRYLQESIAEDFRVLLTNPSLIPPERLSIMEQIFKENFPDQSLDDIRSGIRTMYGTLYGIGVEDVQRPDTDHHVEEMSEMLDRRYQAQAKESRTR